MACYLNAMAGVRSIRNVSRWHLYWIVAAIVFANTMCCDVSSFAVVIIDQPPGWNPEPTIEAPYDPPDDQEPPPPETNCDETMGAINRPHGKAGSKPFRLVFQGTSDPPRGPAPPPCRYTPATPPPCPAPCATCSGPPKSPGPGGPPGGPPPKNPGGGTDGSGPSVGPATSSFPVLLRDGALVEDVTDLEIPGPGFTWKVSRNYRSVAYAPDGTTTFGNKWFSSDAEMRLRGSVGADTVLILSSSSQRMFSFVGSSYTSPPDSNLVLTREQVGTTSTYLMVVTDTLTGEVLVFNDFDPTYGNSQLHERTTRYRRAQGLAGAVYSYDYQSRLATITLPQGQDYYVEYSYVGLSKRCSQISVWKTSAHDVELARINYTYYSDGPTMSKFVGSEGDLIQVSVKRRDSSLANWIERDTQYRYYRSESADASSGFIKAIYEHDAVQRVREANGCSSLAGCYALGDCGNVGGSGGSGGAPMKSYASRWISYYTWDEGGNNTHYNTLWNSDEDLIGEYGGTNTDEVIEGGPVREESIGASCAACGGSDHSVKKRYHYIYMNKDGSSAHAYYVNHGQKANINEVSFLVIEDTATQSGTPLYRKIYGLNDYYRKLREVFIENPTDSNPRRCWCQAWVYTDFSTDPRKESRVAEYRGPATYTVTTNAKIKQFLDPYDHATNSWANDTAVLSGGGEIKLYEYNSDGFLTGTLSKEGVSGTANYLSATDYGDADGDSAGRDNDYHSIPVATYTYATATATRSAGIKTEYHYTFWDTDDTQIKSIITVLPKIAISQNGAGNGSSDPQVQTEEYYDNQGRLRWSKDGEGYVNYYSYNPNSGKLAYTAVDVDPTSLPSSADDTANATKWAPSTSGSASSNKPSRAVGSVTLPTALALVTTDELDLLGRQRLRTDPRGHQHYTAYQVNGTACSQVEWTIEIPYWSGSAAQLPIRVRRLDHTGKVDAVFTLAPSTALTAGTGSALGPVGLTYAPTVANYQTLTLYSYDSKDGSPRYVDRYYKMPSSLPGSLSINFNRIGLTYNAEGRLAATVASISGSDSSATVQVQFKELDKRGRPTRTIRWRDTSFNFTTGLNFTGLETTALSNHPASSLEYDGGGIGNGYVTSSRQYYGVGTNDYIETINKLTYRGHRRGVDQKNGTTEFGPYQLQDINWQGDVTATATYTTAPTTWPTGYADYVHNPSANSGVGGPTGSGYNDTIITKYDDLGRAYQLLRFPSTQSAKRVETNNYYDRKGRIVCTGDKYSAQVEYAYDGAGRQYQARRVLDVAATPYSSGKFQFRAPAPHPALGSMSTSGDDGLIEFSHAVYDEAGNVTEKHTFELNHTDTNGIDIDATDSYVRRTIFNWYDAEDRLTTTADYGSGDGTSSSTSWAYTTRPSRPSEPTWTDSMVYNGYVLLTKYGYDAALGRMDTVTAGVSKNGSDTKKMVTKSFFDALGRRIAVGENYDNFSPPTTNIGDASDTSKDRVTSWAYNGLGKVTVLTAYNGSSTNAQATKYLYEDANDAWLATSMIYPDSTDTNSSGTNQVKLEYNLDGTAKKKTDQRGVVLEYTYNNARQLTREAATTIPSSVDDSVKSIARGYDTLGRLGEITSYANNDGTGTIRNVIGQTFDTSVNKIHSSIQSHEGAVSSGTPIVWYTYDTSTTSDVYDDGLRLGAMHWPTGLFIAYGFGSGGTSTDISDRLNRITEIYSNLSGTSTIESEYEYNGTGRVVRVSYPIPSIESRAFNLDASGGNNNYNAFDQFGREVKREWWRYSSSQFRDRFDYTLDYAGSRLSRHIPTAVYAANDQDQVYGYDGLQRLKTFTEGTPSGTPTLEQDWTLDQLGNWPGFVVKAAGATTLDQNRSHNKANEIDVDDDHSNTPGNSITATIGTNWADPTHDAAGNMTTIPKPADPANGFSLKYDAWNRLIEVKAGSTIVQNNEYDGLGRRIQKVVGSDTYDYYYNEDWQLVEERKNGTPINDYFWHPYYIDALAVRYNFPTTSSYVAYYHQHDASFNVTAVANSTATVLERYNYSPYGEVRFLNADFTTKSTQVTSYGNNHFYTGRERDAETGLQLNRHRFDDAPLGRWTTRDPNGYVLNRLNLYEYVGSNPIVRGDPSGLVDCCGNPPQAYFPNNDEGCCNGVIYNTNKQCCVNGEQLVDKIPIYKCSRWKCGNMFLGTFITHSYICCDAPNGNQCYGLEPGNEAGGDVTKEETKGGTCVTKFVCPTMKRCKCGVGGEGPKAPHSWSVGCDFYVCWNWGDPSDKSDCPDFDPDLL